MSISQDNWKTNVNDGQQQQPKGKKRKEKKKEKRGHLQQIRAKPM